MKTANRKNWSKIEDRYLVEIMRKEEKPIDWEEVSQKMKEQGYLRNAKQIKSRWVNNLDPDLTKEKWCKTDILRLFLLYDEKGNRWQEIAASFEGRTDNCIKNQLFSSIRKGLRSIIKELGLETGYSYTTMINQIKPKILAEFLLQKLSVKESNGTDALRDINASDLIKNFLFKSKHIYQTDSIYEKKEVMHAFIQILINMNNEYIKNKKISRFNKNDNSNSTPPLERLLTDNLKNEFSNDSAHNLEQLLFNQSFAAGNKAADIYHFESLETDQLLIKFREALESRHISELANEPHSSSMLKQDFSDRFGKLAKVTKLLINRLTNLNSRSNEDFEAVKQFMNGMNFLEGDLSTFNHSLNVPAQDFEYSSKEDSRERKMAINLPRTLHDEERIDISAGNCSQQIRKIEIPRPLTLRFK